MNIDQYVRVVDMRHPQPTTIRLTGLATFIDHDKYIAALGEAFQRVAEKLTRFRDTIEQTGRGDAKKTKTTHEPTADRTSRRRARKAERMAKKNGRGR